MGYVPDGDFGGLLRVIRTHRDPAKLTEKMHRLHTDFVSGSAPRMPFIPLWQLGIPILLRRDLQTVPVPAQLDPLTVFGQAEEWKLVPVR